jgi:hypothetical protein
MALISQSSFRGNLPSSPSQNELRWEHEYLQRRARDARRYQHTYREESGVVQADTPSQSPEGSGEPMVARAPAPELILDEPTTRRDRAQVKATAAQLRDEAASPAKRRYRRNTK